MGLDTHDYGILTKPMKAGMVFTVEPGIYIGEHSLASLSETTRRSKARKEENANRPDSSDRFCVSRVYPRS